MRRESMPPKRDRTSEPAVQDALRVLRPNPEIHNIDPSSHCVNPKCDYNFTSWDEQNIKDGGGEFTCPKCNFSTNYHDIEERSMPGGFAPGGMTRSTLTLDEMGRIGEQVVLQMEYIPGVGQIVSIAAAEGRTSAASYPVDTAILGDDGTVYGVEIKSNHSEAQPRFKIGGKKERADKIQYCYSHGLKPALIGVRLNFFDDLADIFFRDGLTDTWIGNRNMRHVAQVNFTNLNPFKTPEAKAQLHQEGMPDQSTEDDGWVSVSPTTPSYDTSEVF